MSKSWGIAAALVVTATMVSASVAGRHFTPQMPSLAVSLSSPVSRLSDFVGIALGFRRLTADIAWIQTLIYYGTRIDQGHGEEGHVHAEDEPGSYPLFKAYCQRVAQIDPHFKYVYFYGSGVLGWNLERLDEAEALLKEAIVRYPKEWRFQQFLAGLAYQKSHNINDLVLFLEAFIQDKECPNVLRSILANIYKKQKMYRQAIRVWMMVYDTGDSMYVNHALAQIQEMAPLAGIKP